MKLALRFLLPLALALGAIDLVRTVVFARILFPEDYGLMALAMMVIGLLESCSTLGIEIAVVRDRDFHADRLPCYWTLKVARGLILALAAWWMAVPSSRTAPSTAHSASRLWGAARKGRASGEAALLGLSAGLRRAVSIMRLR